MKVLVIEDNPSNMVVARTILEHNGHLVLSSSDAEHGLKLAHSDHPDLILMDIQLPNMNGFDATRLLKSDPETKAIPVVALTAYAMSKDERSAFEAGCDGYLTKPYKIEGLLEVLRQHGPPE